MELELRKGHDARYLGHKVNEACNYPGIQSMSVMIASGKANSIRIQDTKAKFSRQTKSMAQLTISTHSPLTQYCLQILNLKRSNRLLT